MVDPMPRFKTVSAPAGSAALAMVKLAATARAADNAVLLVNAMNPLPDFQPCLVRGPTPAMPLAGTSQSRTLAFTLSRQPVRRKRVAEPCCIQLLRLNPSPGRGVKAS